MRFLTYGAIKMHMQILMARNTTFRGTYSELGHTASIFNPVYQAIFLEGPDRSIKRHPVRMVHIQFHIG